MDELVEERLKAMGYKSVPKELVALLNEWKRRQDAVRPAPLSLDAIVCCTMMYKMYVKAAGKAKQEQEEQEGK